MTLFPRSLATRAFLLIALLILLSLIASTILFRQAERTPRAMQLAQMVTSVVNLTRAAVLSADPTLRSALLDEMAESDGIRVFLADPHEQLVPFALHYGVNQKMATDIRIQLGPNTRFASARNGEEGFWVSFFIGDQEFWIMMPAERIERPKPWQWLGWSVLVMFFALIGGALIARQVGKPLKKLASAAYAVGHGETPAPLEESGAEETIAVVRAFNQMSSDLAAIEQERALVLAGISHDLRTPLTRLRIAAEFIDDEASREGMISDVEQMDAVVGQFLEYARLGEQEPIAEIDLQELVSTVAAPYMKRGKSLLITLAEFPPVKARPQLLKRALTNLIDNAIKYGGDEISLECFYADWHGRPCAFFVIQDRGPGIPSEDIEKAKHPFVRLETARSGVGGSGLGLAIVERAARIHGGELRLTSREGGGLTATLVIPVTP